MHVSNNKRGVYIFSAIVNVVSHLSRNFTALYFELESYFRVYFRAISEYKTVEHALEIIGFRSHSKFWLMDFKIG